MTEPTTESTVLKDAFERLHNSLKFTAPELYGQRIMDCFDLVLVEYRKVYERGVADGKRAALDEPELDLAKLSGRERELVTSLRMGERLSVFAARTFISKHTARVHLKSVFRKLGVHSQVELLAKTSGASL
jgi:DNA-binding NarL/FixJ family response regulator